MSDTQTTLLNRRGGLYDSGVAFTRARWLEIAHQYEDKMYLYGRCSQRRLVTIACTSLKSAAKAIETYQSGASMSCREPRGHRCRGVRLLSGWEPCHDAYMYDLYRTNPSLPLNGYTQELEKTFGLVVNVQLISRWFNTIGTFKGSMRVTSAFTSGRNS